jgi:cytochrome c553
MRYGTILLMALIVLSTAAFSPLRNAPPAGKPVAAKPVQLWQRQCASCHGETGENFHASFRNVTENRLQTSTRDMAEMRDLQLSDPQYWALIAYLRSVREKEPFIAWVAPNELETCPNAAIKLEPKGTATKIAPGRWRITGFDPARTTVVATSRKKTTRLVLKRAAYSHGDPIPGR